MFLVAAAFLVTGCASKKIAYSGPAIPTLTFKVNCGKCEYKESGAALIAEGYKEAAKEQGAPISTSETAEVTILDYNARNSSARFWLGAMAGRDTIKTSVKYKNRTFEVENFYANAIKGIDDLARDIGEDIYKEIVKK